MFFAFIYLALLYWDHNIPEKNDIRWAKGVIEVLKGNEHAVADNGKYNLGQKMLFWTLNLAMVTLLVTGIIMWRQYFHITSQSQYCELLFYSTLQVLLCYSLVS